MTVLPAEVTLVDLVRCGAYRGGVTLRVVVELS